MKLERCWLLTGEVALPQLTPGLALPALLHGAGLYPHMTPAWPTERVPSGEPSRVAPLSVGHRGVWEAPGSEQRSWLGAWLPALVTVRLHSSSSVPWPTVCPVTVGSASTQGKA